MSLYAMLKPKGPSGFGYGSTAEDVTAGLSLAGKTILVTGCNSGLGLETARVLALRGARVFGTARTKEKADDASAWPGGGRGLRVRARRACVEVRSAVAAITAALGGAKLDAIIANAGIMALPKNAQAFGIDLQLFTNHIGHFMLVTGLLDALADDGRVVMLSSSAHGMAPRGGIEFDNLSGARDYQPWKQYGQSKMANLLFAKELARRFEGTRRVGQRRTPRRHPDQPGSSHEPRRDLLLRPRLAAGAEERRAGGRDHLLRRTYTPRPRASRAGTSPTATSPRSAPTAATWRPRRSSGRPARRSWPASEFARVPTRPAARRSPLETRGRVSRGTTDWCLGPMCRLRLRARGSRT
jgi:NAD(P)-dependent dehydrogenase (short-subunit alcohol dehydrogenase family)